MNPLKIATYCLLHVVITTWAISNNNLAFNHQLGFVSETIKQNLHVSPATVFVKSAKNLSPTSTFLLGQLVSTFPSAYSEMYQLENFSSDEKSICMLNLLCEWSEREIVKIMIINAHDSMDIEKELVEVIDFLVTFGPQTVRPQCLIVIISNFSNQDFLSFFEYGWMNDFLDITILQIVEQNSSSLFEIKHNILEVKIHTYNPFNKNYAVKEFHSDIDIFDDKLANLHKTVLKASFFKEFPDLIYDKSYTGDNLWNALKGRSVYLMKVVAGNLNFSIKVTAAWDNYYDLSKFNVSYDPDATKKKLTDFILPGLTLNGNASRDKMVYEYACLLKPNPNHILVRQYGIRTSYFSFTYIIMFIVGMSMIILFSVLLRRRYRNEFWSALNTIKILLRIQIDPAPRTAMEKCFLLFLTCLSVLYMEEILEKIINIYLVEDNYRELKTLKDLVHSGITPSISKDTKGVINYTNYTDLKMLSDKSKILESYGLVENCVSQLIHNLDDIEGCEINRLLGKLAVQVYSKVKKGSILTLVEEPLFPGYMAIPFTKTSPYARRIDRVARRLFDSGVVDFFHKISMSRLSLDRNKFYYPGNFPKNQSEIALLYEAGNLESSRNNLFIFLTYTYVLSIFIFAIEIIWKITK